MKSIDIKSLKDMDRKQAAKSIIGSYKSHNLAVLAVFAGLLIGFSLLRVDSLNKSVTDTSIELTGEDAEEFTPLILQKISLDEETVSRLETLAADTDVEINSSLPGNRDNPFDDGTAAPAATPAPTEAEPDADGETAESADQPPTGSAQ